MKRALLFSVVLLAVAALIVVLYMRSSQPPPPPPVVVTKPIVTPTPTKEDPGAEALKIVLDPNAAYEERVLASKRLPKILNTKQAEALRGLVLTKGVHPTIRNDVLDFIDLQPVKPVGIAQELVGMYRDQSEDKVWRDYCLQFLEKVYEFSPEKDMIEKTLLEAAGGKTDGKSNFPGTAMLSLERLGKNHPAVAAALEKLAERGVASAAEDPEKAVTALQVARAAGDKSVLAEARKIAVDEKALVRLRMSAISTLGELGEAGDAALLKQLAENPDSRIKSAAKAGLQTLEKAGKTANP